jgi:nucleotide-binding universal stress UspA family protein
LRRARCPVLVLRSPEHPYATPVSRVGSPSSWPDTDARTPHPAGGKGRPRRTVWTIVHPTDFSGCSNVALRAARALACDLGTHLILLHVVSVIPVPHLNEPAAVEDPETCRQTLEGLCECLDDADLKYPVTPLLKLGQSAVEILRTADETGCNLIVLGTHGRTGLGRLLLGSVAEQVLRRARCPVLLIKAAGPTLSTAEHDTVVSQSGMAAASPACS